MKNLDINKVKQIYVNRGPGSFAGIRNSLAIVKAFNVASQIDYYSFSFTDFVGENNVSNVSYLDCVIDGGNSGVGFLDTVTINAGGANYTNGQVITFPVGGAGGGPPTTVAQTVITTDGSGQVISTQTSIAGSGYYSNSTPDYSNLTGGDGNLDVTGNFDYGYGFPKDPNGDFTTIIDNVLTRFTGTVGTVVSLSDINPGNNYNFNHINLGIL